MATVLTAGVRGVSPVGGKVEELWRKEFVEKKIIKRDNKVTLRVLIRSWNASII